MNHAKCGNCTEYTNLVGCKDGTKVFYNTSSCGAFRPVWLNLPSFAQTHASQVHFLEDNLDKLKDNQDLTLWFGNKENLEDKQSLGLGIRFMQTAGGPQFRLFSVDFFGREHSSGYYQYTDEVIPDAMSRVGNYLRPLRLTLPSQVDRPRPYLSWFFEGSLTEGQLRNPDFEKDIEALGGSDQVVTIWR